MANPAVVVDFLANTAQLKKALGDAGKETKTFGSKLSSVAKGAAVAAGAAGVGALVATLKIGIGEYTEATKVAAQTNQVLKSTGDAANVTAGHISDLAGEIMKKSGIDDEAVQSGENLLLTFTNIRNEAGKGNDIFDQTTKIMADMSTALGQDTKSSAIQLGKALNDPIKGVTALQRVGVSFTAGQKETIKALVDSGKRMDAQKLILKELTKEFGGSAEAAGKTLPGQINIAKETFNNFAGMLVSKMIPVLEDVVGWLKDNWPEIQRAIKSFWAYVEPIFSNLIDILVEVVRIIQNNWGTIGPLVMGVARIIGDAAKIIGTALKLITDLLKGDWGAAWDDMVKIVKTAFDLVKTAMNLEVTLIFAIAKKIGNAILDGIGAVLDNLGDSVRGQINRDITFGAEILGAVEDRARKIGAGIVAGITGVLDSIGDKVRGPLNAGIQFGEEFLAAMHDRAAQIGTRIVNGIVSLIGGVGERLRTGLNNEIQFGADFLALIYGKGVTMGDKLKDGIVHGMKGLAGLLSRILRAGLNAALSVWNSLRIPGFHVKINMPGPIPDINFGWGGLDLPNIPLLAKGGVVDTPTLAVVGERGREIVSPEPLLRQLLAEARPDVRVFIGERELTDLVRVEVVNQNNRTAQTLLAGAV